MSRRKKNRRARRRVNTKSGRSETRIKELTLECERLRAELDGIRSGPHRRRLPDTRQSITHKFSICGHEGYIAVGLHEDGSPGEVFIRMAKMGSTVRGLVDTIAVLTSLALQYGVPVEDLVRKFQHTRFEPSGYTKNSDIPRASSISDYLFTWLGVMFADACQDNSLSFDDSGESE